MTRTLHQPPPLAPTLGCRAWWRNSRQRRGAHPRQETRGYCRQAPAANAGRCRPARPSGAPVGRRYNIATTDGAMGAPTSRLCAWSCRTRLWTGWRGEVGKKSGAKGWRQRRFHAKITTTSGRDNADDNKYNKEDAGGDGGRRGAREGYAGVNTHGGRLADQGSLWGMVALQRWIAPHWGG